jgi:multiple sugar transport system substrate-binding protein
MHWLLPIILAAALVMAPLGARAADLVVWWEKGFYPQADAAVAEIVTAFAQQTGKQVELVQPAQDEIIERAVSALQAGAPPDFLFSSVIETSAARWAYEDRLVDLEGVLGPVLDLFDADSVEVSTLLDGKTGRRGLYALPMGRISNHVHVWNSLLERAGFTLADIPQEWEAFWSFWCDRVQPALRKAIGREDIWAVGLPMSVAATIDTDFELTQFQLAYQASWLSPDRRVQLDDPAVRARMVRAMGAYTEIWRKGCTPPDAVNWTNIDNNKAFLAQTVVMTANPTLSIPAALRTARPDDYYRNAASIDWPRAADGAPLVLEGRVDRAVVFRAGGHSELAKEFVRFLAERGLAQWVTFMGDQYMPPMRKLVEQPFWLDSSDPHRMRAAIQILSQPHAQTSNGVWGNEWRSGRIWQENLWGKAVHRVVTDGLSPAQAVDEAIARIKEILAE